MDAQLLERGQLELELQQTRQKMRAWRREMMTLSSFRLEGRAKDMNDGRKLVLLGQIRDARDYILDLEERLRML